MIDTDLILVSTRNAAFMSAFALFSLLLGSLAFPGDAPAQSHQEQLEWSRLNARAMQLYRVDRYDEALVLSRQALRMAERIFPRNHRSHLDSMSNLALVYREMGDYDQAETLFVRTYRIRKRIHGVLDPGTVLAQIHLASNYLRQNRFRQAETNFLEAIRNAERAFPPTDRVNVIVRNDLAVLYTHQGRFVETEKLLEEVRKIQRATLRPDHPEYLVTQNNLGNLYVEQGRYREAENLLRQTLQQRLRVHGPEHEYTLNTMNNLGVLYEKKGRYDEAERLAQTVLAVRRKRGYPGVMVALNNLAVVYESQGLYGKAEEVYTTALRNAERTLRNDHPRRLSIMNNLALLYTTMGDFALSEKLLQVAYRLRKSTLGEENPDTIQSLFNLGGVYHDRGEFARAEPIYKRAIAASTRQHGEDHPNTILYMNGLAVLYADQRRDRESRDLLERALALGRKDDTFPDAQTQMIMNNLAGRCADLGCYNRARKLYAELLELRTRTLGPRHPDTLLTLNNEAHLFGERGQHHKAAEQYASVLKNYRETLGPEHPSTLTAMNNLAVQYDILGRFEESEKLFLQVLRAQRKLLRPTHPRVFLTRLNLAILRIRCGRVAVGIADLESIRAAMAGHAAIETKSQAKERVQRSYLTDTFKIYKDIVLTLAKKHPSRAADRLAALTVLRTRQLQLEEEAFFEGTVRKLAARDANIHESLERRNGLLARYATLSLRSDPNEERQILVTLDRLERTNADLRQRVRQSGGSRVGLSAVEKISPDAIGRSLPRDALLIEFQIFIPFDFDVGDPGRKGNEHIAALVWKRGQSEPGIYHLGPVNVQRPRIDRLGKKGAAAETAAREIYRDLFAPMAGALAAARTVYIAPDRDLTRIPFDRLRLPDGRYWIEEREIRILQTAREILVESATPRSDAEVIIVGDVDYSKFTAGQPGLSHEQCTQRRRGSGQAGTARCWKQLRWSREEAGRIQSRYKDLAGPGTARWIYGIQASEAYFARLQRPRILHFSTHAFFRAENQEQLIGRERPLALSGLAISGANRGLVGETGPDGSDGILTGLEVVGLDLRGTELVVLSACDTASGVVDVTEGIYGLSRAFRIAGARSVLITLQDVGDRTTMEFMLRFYRLWLENPDQGFAGALRATKLSYIASDVPNQRDPRVWSAFVLSGK